VGTPDASVVIPCYNNASVLAMSLRALTRQTLPLDRFEVIVVDDGSADHPEDVVTALGLPRSFRYIRQSNQGAATARNRGGSKATGDVLVFLDSDVIPDATLLHEHLESHRVHKRALVVGRSRAIPADGFDRFYEVMGDSLFSFNEGDVEKLVTFQEVLSRNLSLHRESFLEIGGFDEAFPRSGFEDIEFAYRATQLGFKVIYNPKAAGAHHHTGTLQEVSRNLYNYQMSAVLLMTKHPEIKGQICHLRDKEPIQWGRDDLRLVGRKLARQAISLAPSVWIMQRAISALERWYPSRSLLRLMYWQVLGSYLFSGFRDGLKRYGLSL
jgi:GT2 family glycosyltransferase